MTNDCTMDGDSFPTRRVLIPKWTAIDSQTDGKVDFFNIGWGTDVSALCRGTSSDLDPVGFIRGLDRVVIDEVQRAPEKLLAIKQSVDEDSRPGRFLLTGSANLLTIRTVHESLAGRVEVIPLYPLARSERLRLKRPQFLDQIFRGKLPQAIETHAGDDLTLLVTAGGYPDAIKRRTEQRRRDWYRAYIDSLVDRDIPDVAAIAGGDQFPELLAICARFAGQLTNLSAIGRSMGRDHKTMAHYLRILEQISLVKTVPPWSRNELSRLMKSPKLHFIDSGLLCALRGVSSSRLRSDRTLLGLSWKPTCSPNSSRRQAGLMTERPFSITGTRIKSKSILSSRIQRATLWASK